jgi:hypothetical protein
MQTGVRLVMAANIAIIAQRRDLLRQNGRFRPWSKLPGDSEYSAKLGR